jgi:hypothetical protein
MIGEIVGTAQILDQAAIPGKTDAEEESRPFRMICIQTVDGGLDGVSAAIDKLGGQLATKSTREHWRSQ